LEFAQILTEVIKWGSRGSDEKRRLARHGRAGAISVPGALPAGFVDGLRNWSRVMKKLLVKLVKDETGGEVLEYALIAGLIVVAAIAVIGTVGTKVLARWTSLNSSL
jgi:pilus assembly protein Flp/PilA